MNVLISINPPYAEMILSGYKFFEFRRKVLREMYEGKPMENIVAYIYETKRNEGCGCVVGELTVCRAYTVNYGKDAKQYIRGKEVERTSALTEARFHCIKTLYLEWCKRNDIQPNMDEGWFKSKEFMAYQREIGFFGEDDSLTFNYALVLDAPKRYAQPKPLSDFINLYGAALTHPPQYMQRVAPLE